MILLRRPPAPAGLAKQQNEWTHRSVARRPNQWAMPSALKLLRENLYPSCGMCNGGKLERNRTDTLRPAQPGRAMTSIALCRLNRGSLCRDRLKQYRSAKRYLDEIVHTGSLPRKLALNFVAFLDPFESYKLAIRAALPPRLADVDRRMFHHAG